MAEGAIQRKSFRFALDVVDLYCKLRDQHEFVLSKQLLRSGTSIGANVEEATAGQSRKDFVSKLSVARKEARETRYWLRLLRESSLTDVSVIEHIAKVDELIRILTSIIISTEEAGSACPDAGPVGPNS